MGMMGFLLPLPKLGSRHNSVESSSIIAFTTPRLHRQICKVLLPACPSWWHRAW